MPFPIGHTAIGLAAFETEIPVNVVTVESATMSAIQHEPFNDFYANGGVVTLEQLVYQTLDKTIVDAIQLHDLGIFCSTDIPNPELDITAVFATNIANGDRNFLYHIVGITDALSASAEFQCDSFMLAVRYLVP